MKYALGNMLNGAGGLNPDGLSLDLQFATDKTLTARRGPTPVFTRASTATFVGSNGLIQSAAINAARFDHDPVALACKGLLIEESRTNLLQRSDDFNNAYWTKTNSSILSDFTTSPSGSVDADKIVEDTSAGAHGVSVNPTITSGIAYTLSFYAKKGERSWIRATVTSSGISTWFDLDSGVIGTVGSGVTASIQSVGGGWYRCVATMTSASTSGNINIRSQTADGQTTFTGDGTSGLFLYGAQLEAGSFPTSYIPTTTAPLTRSADVCSITGSAFSGFYNQAEGALLVNAFTPASGDRTVVATDDNTANEMIRLRTESTNPFFKVTDGGSELVAIDAGTVVANTAFKLAGAYKLNDFASSINGGVAVTDASGTIPTVDRMRIGAGQSGNTMCGCVASLRYYKKRLSDAKLQTLTA